MNYKPNRTRWKVGALVLHDCDAKRPDMLMRVVEYTPDGDVRTEYVDDVLRKEWGVGRKSKLVNPLRDLHGPRRFGVVPGSAVKLTEWERGTLRHTLGVDRNRKAYRNHYCATDGAKGLESMVDRGLMSRGATLNGGDDRYYHVTAAGAKAVGARLPKD